MSLAHLENLAEELPDLFQPRDLAPEWDEGWIIQPINNPEFFGEAGYQDPLLNSMYSDWDVESYAGQLTGWWELSPESISEVIGVFGYGHSGAPVSWKDPSKMPAPECLAFYLPFHYYLPTWWGVYLLLEGVIWLAGEIVRRSGGLTDPRRAVEAARLFLFYHEAFHHKTECFATRLELTHRRPLFKVGFERLYEDTVGKNSCLEEGLANASALMETRKRVSDPRIAAALEGYVRDSPPGYAEGFRIQKAFHAIRCEFAENNQRICFPHLPHKNSDVWRTAPHMFNGIANIRSRVNYVIPRRSPLAERLPFRPLMSPVKLTKKLKELAGLKLTRNGGNHDVYRARNGRSVAIPRHPRDLGRGLVRQILKEVGLDIGLEEFLRS